MTVEGRTLARSTLEDLRNMAEKAFERDAADMTASGFKMQYDNVYPECGGSMRHQTLWMKEE